MRASATEAKACLCKPSSRSEPFQALAEAIVPGTAGLNVERRRLMQHEPAPDGARDELRAGGAAQRGGPTVLRQEPAQHADDAPRWQGGGDLKRQTLAGELVHHRQQLAFGAAETRIV